MTVGEHLEELRTRLLLAIAGLAVAVLGCLLAADKVMVFFCAPLNKQLLAHGLPPTIHYVDLTEPFMTYLKITMITAAAIAGPWMIYQVWLFVAAGLYPKERKAITRYIPLSIFLFLLGLVFVYVIVLPLCIRFFLDFSTHLSPAPTLSPGGTPIVETDLPFQVPMIAGDLKTPKPGNFWFDTVEQRLKIAVEVGKGISLRSIQFGPDSMMAPTITIGDYISLVITFMLTFGIAFQLPLVMLAVVTIGICDVTFLRTQRKAIFFGMTVAAAFIAPGDIITSMLALLIPLIVLYEFGLILIRFNYRRKAKEEAATDNAA